MRSPAIVYVEDLIEDVIFLQRALNKAGLENELIHLRKLEDAIAFFKHYDIKKNSIGLVLVDHKLNGVSSEGFVRDLRRKFGSRMTVVEITGSDLLAEAKQKELGRSFVVKPMDVGGWTRLVKSYETVLARHPNSLPTPNQ